jgi:uncharacterized tellurite resistance protein B-like protein
MSLAARLLALFGQSRGATPERSSAEAEFKLLVALAEVDSVLTDSETANLGAAARELVGADVDVPALVREARSGSVDDLAAEVRSAMPRAARVALLTRAASLAAVDGETSEMEAANLERLARLLGVPAPSGDERA